MRHTFRDRYWPLRLKVIREIRQECNVISANSMDILKRIAHKVPLQEYAHDVRKANIGPVIVNLPEMLKEICYCQKMGNQALGLRALKYMGL